MALPYGETSRPRDEILALDRYNVSMRNDFLEFRGRFTYRDQGAIDSALTDARQHLENADLSDVDLDWMRYVWRVGMTLHIDAILPSAADPIIAAGILGALSRQAVAGHVQVTRLNQCLDTFESDAIANENVARSWR